MGFRQLLAALSLTFVAPWVFAQPKDESLLVNLGRQSVADSSGTSVGADWITNLGGASYAFGAEGLRVADNDWWLLKASTVRSLGQHWVLSGGIQSGPAQLSGQSLIMRKLRLGADYRVSQRWFVHSESAYYDVAPLAGHLVTVGASWLAARVSLRGQVSRDLSGNIDDRTALLRADIPRERFKLFAGAARGESNNEDLLLRLVQSDFKQRTRTLFIGATVPAGDLELTVALDVVKSRAANRHAISFTLKKPVGWLGK